MTGIDTRKIILAGHAGLEKRTVAERVCKYLEFVQKEWKNRTLWLDLDDALREVGEPTQRQMVDVKSSSQLREAWMRGWNRLLEKINKDRPRCAVVSVHFVLADKSQRVSPAILNLIADWQPDLIVTLIDDVYAVKRRIQGKDYDFTLQQLYDWRTIELIFADQVALLASEKKGMRLTASERPKALTDSIVLSVNSPVRTLARLITQTRACRVYASFPITSTRSDPAKRAAIDDFRRKLHEDFVVFDPLAIDELPLLKLTSGSDGSCSFDPASQRDNGVNGDVSARWSPYFSDATDKNGLNPLLPPQSSLELRSGKVESFYPVRFPEDEIKMLKYGDVSQEETTVDDHVTARDLRLVEQADFLVAYRPWWQGHLTRGVRREIVHATSGCRPPRDVYAYVADDSTTASALEEKVRFKFPDEDEFWGAMQELAKKEIPHPRPLYY